MSAAWTGDQGTRNFYIKGDLLRKKMKEPDLHSRLGGGPSHGGLKLPTAVFIKLFPSSSSASAHTVSTQGSAKHTTKTTMAWNALLNLIYNPNEIRGELQEVHNPLELHVKFCMPMHISIFFFGERVYSFPFTSHKHLTE